MHVLLTCLCAFLAALGAGAGAAAPKEEVRVDGLTADHAGNRIAFRELRLSGRDIVDCHLCVLDVRTGEVKRLADTPGLVIDSSLRLSWSPDDEQVVFTLVEGTQQKPGRWAIWALTLEDGEFERIARLPGRRICQYPLFSPDGRFIALRDSERHDLAVFDVGKGKLRYVTDTGDVGRAYAWANAGNRIYCGRGYMAPSDGIWAVNVETSRSDPVFSGPKLQGLAVRPGTGTLAFVTDDRAGFVYVLREDGEAPVKLASFGQPPLRWSPTGGLLAFEARGRTTVWDPERDELLLEFEDARCPEWVGSAGRIAFVRGDKEICICEIATGRTEVVYTAEEPTPNAVAGDGD